MFAFSYVTRSRIWTTEAVAPTPSTRVVNRKQMSTPSNVQREASRSSLNYSKNSDANMKPDYQFAVKMLKKQKKHLGNVKKSLDSYIENQLRLVASLERLDKTKYGNVLKEAQFKLAEALTKLGFVTENYEKLNEQIPLIIATHNVEEITYAEDKEL